MSISTSKKIAAGAFATAVVGATLAVGLAGSPAGSEPYQFKATNFAGVGSDTTMEVMNAFGGKSGDIYYTPLTTSEGNVLLNFDARGPGNAVNTCIATRTESPSFYRPNGSSEGRRAVSRAIDGTNYGIAGCGLKPVSGFVDYARSSAGPPTPGPGVTGTAPCTEATGTCLVYIPFSRDALSWAYANTSGTPVTDLSQAQLDSLFTNGPTVLDPDGAGPQPSKLLVPCGIQTGSGTYQSWRDALPVSTADDAAATDFCNDLLGVPDKDGRLQESKADEVRIKADILATTSNDICDGVINGNSVPCAGGQVIAGFSAANYIAAENGVVPFADPITENVFLGRIGGVDPLDANGDANGAFYNNTTFGRNVYNVLPEATALDPFSSIAPMFVGSGSLVCQATATITTFGFLNIPTCGDTTLLANKLGGTK